jgi:hypothetical protein
MAFKILSISFVFFLSVTPAFANLSQLLDQYTQMRHDLGVLQNLSRSARILNKVAYIPESQVALDVQYTAMAFCHFAVITEFQKLIEDTTSEVESKEVRIELNVFLNKYKTLIREHHLNKYTWSKDVYVCQSNQRILQAKFWTVHTEIQIITRIFQEHLRIKKAELLHLTEEGLLTGNIEGELGQRLRELTEKKKQLEGEMTERRILLERDEARLALVIREKKAEAAKLDQTLLHLRSLIKSLEEEMIVLTAQHRNLSSDYDKRKEALELELSTKRKELESQIHQLFLTLEAKKREVQEFKINHTRLLEQCRQTKPKGKVQLLVKDGLPIVVPLATLKGLELYLHDRFRANCLEKSTSLSNSPEMPAFLAEFSLPSMQYMEPIQNQKHWNPFQSLSTKEGFAVRIPF